MLLEADDSSIAVSNGEDIAEQPELDKVQLKFIDLYYVLDDMDEPIIHLFARDTDLNKWHIEVDDFYPYFCIYRDISNELMKSLNNDHRVRSVDFEEGKSLGEEDLWKVEVTKPKHIRELRDELDTLEADVDYTDRFLIDTNIRQWFEVPEDADQRHISWTEIKALEEPPSGDGTPGVKARVLTFDIEVKMSDEGPSVVSDEGTELARQPITAITAHDNYCDEYTCWVLEHPSWDDPSFEDMGADVKIFSDERGLLQDFVEYVKAYDFDILTGWNSNNFDTPYLVNRCLKEQGIYSIMDWSPTRDVKTMNGDGKWISSDLKGIMLFDMLTATKKTQRHEMKSYSLANVAAELLDIGKLDIDDIDDAWENAPESFVEYNIRDTEAVVEIDREIGILVYDGRDDD